MEILIDTNVVMDWLLDREPFVEQADKIMKYCVSGKAKGHLASHTVLNIFYITRKTFDVETRKEIALMLCEMFTIIGISKDEIIESLHNKDWDDLEDGLQMQGAINEGLDYIITRDMNGFETSKVQVLSPEIFLEMLEEAATHEQ